MAPLDTDLVTAFDKMMRSDLDAWSSLWFWILVGSTIAVAVGIVAEAPEVWKEVGLGRKTVARVRRWWYIRVRRIDLNGWEKVCPELITKNDFRRRWVLKAAFIGWVLVALGVAGEGFAEYFVNDAETNIRAFDEGILGETEKQAGDAATNALRAENAANVTSKKLDEGLKTANQLAMLDHRPLLLEQNKAAFINALKRFPKQPISILSCGNDNEFGNREASDVRDKLVGLLGTDGAGWKVTPVSSTRDDCPVRILSNPPGVGGIVLALSVTPEAARHSATVAAQKLADTLNNIRITTSIAPETRANIMPDVVPPGSVWKSLNDDPKAIFLLVGDNPLE